MLETLDIRSVFTAEEWIQLYRDLKAFFMHDGINKNCPHPILRSGKHSNAFLNSDILLQHPGVVQTICFRLLQKCKTLELDLISISRVVGPAMGAIILSHEFSSQLHSITQKDCLSGYTEKATVLQEEIHRFARVLPTAGETLLILEDVLSSGSSVRKTAAACDLLNLHIFPFVFCIVNRSGQTVIDGRTIISLVGQEIDRFIQSWDITVEQCPLCALGSEAIENPKKVENWPKFWIPSAA